MNYKLKIRSCAEKDIAEAAKWYEKQLKGLGSRFIESTEAALLSVKANPETYPKVYKDFRRTLLKRFPYSLFYFIEQRTVVVIALFHERKNQDRLKERI